LSSQQTGPFIRLTRPSLETALARLISNAHRAVARWLHRGSARGDMLTSSFPGGGPDSRAQADGRWHVACTSERAAIRAVSKRLENDMKIAGPLAAPAAITLALAACASVDGGR